jgi:hypothetical protein
VNRPARYSGPPLTVEQHYVGHKALEPTVALDKAGNAFYVAAYWSPTLANQLAAPTLMRSSDAGRTWEAIPGNATGSESQLTVDPFVYGDADFGRVFNVDLLLAGSQVSYTDDGGATWASTVATDAGANDHQSLVSGLAPDANTLLTPLDPSFPKLVYYCVNEVSRSGCSLSRDGGRSWAPTGGSPYLGAGTNPGDGGNAGPVCSALAGHLQTDLNGRLMQPSGHCGQPYLSISEDGGTTWQQILVDAEIRAAEPHTEVATDRANNLHYLWHDPVHFLLWMASSRDHGKTWTDPVNVVPPGVHSVNHGTIVAGESGRVAVSFVGSTTADEESPNRPWNQYVVVTPDAFAPEPLMLSAIGHRAGDPVLRGSCRGRCGGLFDFGDIQISPVDGAIWATGSDSCTAERDCNTAYDAEDLSATATPGDADGFVIRQTGGPLLTGPLEPFSAEPATPAPAGPAAQRDRLRPTVRLTLSRRSFRIRPPRTATVFRLRLSESATVSVRIQQRRRGRWRKVGALDTSAASGVTGLRFKGLVNGRRLRRGRYRATAYARDSAGNTGHSRTVAFRIR